MEVLDKLQCLEELPSPPQVAIKAVEVCQDPDRSLRELAEILMLDSALATKVLRVSNSAAYSRGREITAVSQAVSALARDR